MMRRCIRLTRAERDACKASMMLDAPLLLFCLATCVGKRARGGVQAGGLPQGCDMLSTH